MKSLNISELDKLKGKKLSSKDTFSFRCYPGIECFNHCCRNLNLFLYPYDVVRLKKNLGLTSDKFIDRYVDVVMRKGNYFPDVLLKMAENEQKTCPYLSEKGCTVYIDRPDACRTFPLEQGVLYNEEGRPGETMCYFRPPSFCLGPKESSLWTCEGWEKDQQAKIYHEMTLKWASLKRMFDMNPWGDSKMENPKAKMAFMAVYNLDKFREFIFSSSFLKRYDVSTSVLKKIKNSDTELMLFGFDWVGYFVWGKTSIDIKQKKFKT